MNNHIEILRKAIDKAITNGLDQPRFGQNENLITVYEHCIKHRLHFARILSIPFAKAFWGEEERYMDIQHPTPIFLWQYHLQQMVILSVDEQIEYLEKFL